MLYLDTDTLFISPVYDVWKFFQDFNSTQIAALSPEHEDENVGWYNRFSRHPYYGKLGVNSGVMLMNLTRMREFKWNLYMLPLYKEYKLKITWVSRFNIKKIHFSLFNASNCFTFPFSHPGRSRFNKYFIRILSGQAAYIPMSI